MNTEGCHNDTLISLILVYFSQLDCLSFISVLNNFLWRICSCELISLCNFGCLMLNHWYFRCGFSTSNTSSSDGGQKKKGPKLPEVKPPTKTKTYIVKKYMGYIERMEQGLEKRSPKAYKIYMLFKIGMASLIFFKRYLFICRFVGPVPGQNLF